MLFISITLLVIYFAVSLKGYDDASIDIIEIGGCYHLSEDQYFKSSNLNDKDSYSDLTLRVIKDRIEKHPYVKSAEVKFESHGKVSIVIEEKKFDAILIRGDKQYLLADDLQVIPVMLYTRGLDYPVIRNAKSSNSITEFSKITSENYPDIILACEAISTIKLINSELYELLSEIDLNDGSGISAYFSTMSYELKLGSTDVVRKAVYFNAWWTKIKNKGLDEYFDYVDLRFANHIFIGFPAGEKEVWDEQS